MPDSSHPPVVSTLAPVLCETVRRLRLARLLMRLGRERHQSTLETLQAAIDLLIEKDNEITRLREQLQHLRDEHRRVREEMHRYVATHVGMEST